MNRIRGFLGFLTYLIVIVLNAYGARAADSYSIKYVLNGGNAVGMPSTYTAGVGATINTVATKAGHKFMGWCTNVVMNECATPQVISATDSGSKTLYAKFAQCAACAPINANCTMSVVNNTCTYTTSCKSGYGNIQNNGRYDAECSAVQYDISYDLDGGVKSASGMPKYYTHIDAATINGVPTKSGYIFVGWCSDATRTNCAMTRTLGTSDTGNKTFYAKWQSCTACATVNASCQLQVENNVCVYQTQCDVGYVYSGANQAGRYDAQCVLANFNLTYQNGLGDNGGQTQTVQYGTEFTPMPATTFSNPGNRIIGWTDGVRFYYPDVAIKYLVNDDSTVQAIWGKCAASNTDGACGCAAGTRPDGNGVCVSCAVSCGDVSGFNLGSYNQCVGETNTACYRECDGDDIPNAEFLTGTVTKKNVKTCTVTKCVTGYYVQNNACVACPENSTNCGTVANPNGYACANGYHKSGDLCVADEYIITLNKNGGTGTVAATVTCKHGQECAPMPSGTITRDGFVFAGWGTDASCTSGVDAIVATGATTLYACWGNATVQCQAGKYYNGSAHVECPSGWYCPGGDMTVATGTSGCRVSCTSLGAEYTTSDAGATAATQCMRACDTATCVQPSKCPSNSTKCTFLTSGLVVGAQYYGSAECNALSDGSQYCPVDTLHCGWKYYQNKATQTCDLCSSLSNVVTYSQSQTGNSGGPQRCYASCSTPCTMDPNLITPCPDNTVEGSCVYATTKTSGALYYPSTTCSAKVQACALTTMECQTGYHKTGVQGTYTAGDVCEANVYEVPLNDNGGDGGDGAVYFKYKTAWFSDNATTNQIGRVAVPQRDGYVFQGYFLTTTGGAAQIAADGTINLGVGAFNAGIPLYAQWVKDTVQCQVGKYYDGVDMVSCPDKQFCPGTGVAQVGTPGCAVACPTGAAGADTDATSATDCWVACPAPRAIENGTLDTYNDKVYYDVAAQNYPTQTACLYTVTCDTPDYVPHGNATTAPSCKYSPAVCPADSYCAPEPVACPAGGKSAAGDVLLTDCYKIITNYPEFKHGVADAKCNYNMTDQDYTDCTVVQPAHSCDAGYWHKVVDDFECVPVDNGWYSAPGDITQTACPAGGNGSAELADDYSKCYKTCDIVVDNADSVVPVSETVGADSDSSYAECAFDVTCKTGYSESGDMGPNPVCAANQYVISLDKNGGTGSVAANVTCTFGSGTCALPDNRDLIYTGHTAVGRWCTADGQRCWRAGENTADNISSVGEDITLYAQWTPNVYKIILDDQVATTAAVPAEVYLKYATGWFTTNTATTPINKITMPTKRGYELRGYYTAQRGGGTQIIDAQGTLLNGDVLTFTTTGPVTLYAYWRATIDSCVAGTYYVEGDNPCIPCTSGNYCQSGLKHSCSDATGGTHTLSAPGAASKEQCYAECKSYEIEYGTAIPVIAQVVWPNACEFRGQSVTGNPCEIVDNVCVETDCNGHYELISGHCMPCNREHAISYKPMGNCVVDACVSGYHPQGDQCVSDVIVCNAPNATAAHQQWDNRHNKYGICVVTECADGYHVESNACADNIQPCDIANGVGEHEWNPDKQGWGECVAVSCNPGYTSDVTEMDARDGAQQCGRCRNAFGVEGQLAVERYSQGCEIAECKYPNELYDLQNNECVPICEVGGYEDETGYRRWNPNTKRCEIECHSGYRMW